MHVTGRPGRAAGRRRRPRRRRARSADDAPRDMPGLLPEPDSAAARAQGSQLAAAISDAVRPRSEGQIIITRRAKRQGPWSRATIWSSPSAGGLAKTWAGRKKLRGPRWVWWNAPTRLLFVAALRPPPCRGSANMKKDSPPATLEVPFEHRGQRGTI